MKKGSFGTAFFLGSFFFLLVLPQPLLAKSGCCSSHGGVNCAAGAQANGKVICNDGWRGSSCYYSEMVMCRGSATPTPYVVKTPSPTKIPTPKPTYVPIKPTSTPTPEPIQMPTSTPTPTPTSTPTVTPTEPSPEVKGESISESPSPVAGVSSESNRTAAQVLGWGTLGSMGFGIYKFLRKHKVEN